MTTFKDFQLQIISGVDAYVSWSRNPHAYSFIRGEGRPAMARAVETLNKYFTNYRKSSRHINDGHGFTGVMCDYGTMPCFLQFQFHKDALRVTVWKAQPDSAGWEHDRNGSHCSTGAKLYELDSFMWGEPQIIETGSFENILK